MSTVTDLIEGVSQPQYFANLRAKHLANGVPFDSYLDEENLGLSSTAILSQFLAALRGSNTDPTMLVGVSYVCASLFLQTASGKGLTALSLSQYQNTRQLASATQGIMRLIASPMSPTYNIVPGQLTVGSADNDLLTYTNLTGGTLLSGGFLDLTFRATSTGSIFNVANSQTMLLKTVLPGVVISNPIYPPQVTWITLAGTDDESDESLKNRDLNRWGTVGAECNAEALKYWGTLPPAGYTSSPVKYIRVLQNFIISTDRTGHCPNVVSIVLGNDTGALLPMDKTAVQGNYENPQKYGIGRKIYYLDMGFLTATIAGTVYIYKESGADPLFVKKQVEASLEDFELFISIGEIITVQKIGARMESANKLAIKEVVLTMPSATLVPSFTQKVKFTLGTINYVTV